MSEDRRSDRPAPLAPTSTNVDASASLAPGTLLSGRYRIIALVGMGGMGVVYRASDEELGVDVALKVLRLDLASNPEGLERFRRELILSRQVTHPNVVRIHDIGESDGLRFLTMDFVEGRSLHQMLQDGPVSPDRAVAIARQVAAGLQQAHDKGIVHRDLKPGNILVDATGAALITDFGVARLFDRQDLTRAGAVVGTPDYLAPEQVCGEPVDGRTDIFALGIVLYEMLTGKLPFAGESQSEALAQRLTGYARDVRDSGVRVAPHVREVIRRCLQRNPSRRFQHARDVATALGTPARRVRPALTRLAAAAGVIAVLATGAWLLVSRDRSTSSSRPADATPGPAAVTVAVLPFAAGSSDADSGWVTTGLPAMLASSLAESPNLHVLDGGRVFRALRDLRVDSGALDERQVGRVAELLGASHIVTGMVHRSGAAMRIDARVTAIEDGRVSPARQLSADADSGALFALVERLADRVRPVVGASDVPPPGEGSEIQTGSAAAAQAYVEGRSHLVRADYAAAAPAFERAVKADPQFAAAFERLSETYQLLGRRDQAVAAAESAERALRTQSSRVAHRVRARLAMLNGAPRDAEKSYARLAETYQNDPEPLLDLAAAQAASGDVAKAAETLGRATSLDGKNPRGWFLLARNTILAGDSRKAIDDYLVRALALHTQLRNDAGRGEVLNAMGVGHHQLGEFPQALDRLTEALAVRRALDDARGMATSLKNRARTASAMNRYKEAKEDLEVAGAAYERIGDNAGVADVTNDIGVMHEGRGAYTDALAAYRDALRIRRDLGDDRVLAQSYDNVGYIYYLQGEYDNARVYWQQALDSRTKAGEKTGVILSTQNMGFLHMAQGRWDEAVRAFVNALEWSRDIDFKNAAAVSYGNLGVLYGWEGRYDAALKSFNDALTVLGDLRATRGLAEFTLKEASTLLDLGRLDDARARLDRATTWVREIGNRDQLAELAALEARWHGANGSADMARRMAAEAVSHARASGTRPAMIRARVAAAEATVRFAPLEPAAARAIAADAEALGDVLMRIHASELEAEALLAARRPVQAEAAGRRALTLASSCGWETGLYRLEDLLGRARDAQGDRAGAANHYRQAAERAGKVRARLSADLQRSFDALPAVRKQ